MSTYVQSGNVIFTSPGHDAAKLAGEIEQRLAADLGVAPKVMLRSRDELASLR